MPKKRVVAPVESTESPSIIQQPSTPISLKAIFKPKKTKVCIVGFAESKTLAPYDDPSYEIWGVNEMYKDPYVKRFDVLFELHGYQWLKEGKRLEGHLEWLQKAKIPIFMQKHFPDIPFSVEYPRKVIEEIYGGYFTNTISWELALAIELGFEEIALYGVNMATKEEYAGQRPSVEYFIGLARGKGIKVYVPPQCDLLKCAYRYGFEDGELSLFAEKVKSFMDEQDKKLSALQLQISNASAAANQAAGARAAMEYIMNAFVYPSGNMPKTNMPEVGK